MSMTHPQLPPAVGISLKAQHYEDILATRPTIGWLEIHPENYMGDGGLPHHYLRRINELYPLSMHGVGLSLGSTEGLCQQHLQALKQVVDQYQPAQVSEHLAWSHHNGVFLNDLLPVPYTQGFLHTVSDNIQQVQDRLQRTILIENPSAYLDFKQSTWSEPDFLRELVKRTGCQLLLDVNNVYVSTTNQQSTRENYSSEDYLKHYPLDDVREIHLAGHTHNTIDQETVLIDDHGSPVTDAVWELFTTTIGRIGKPIATLIEWDTNIPSLDTLVAEAHKAQERMITDA